MKVIITFMKLIRDGKISTRDGEYLVSRIFFDLQVGNKMYPGLSATIKQKTGNNSESSPLEVSEPEGYEGPLNFGGFRNVAVSYYRGLTGQPGPDIDVTPENTINRIEIKTFYINVRG